MATQGEWKIPAQAQPRPADYGYDLDRALSAVLALSARIVDAGKDESPDVKADAPARQAFTAYGVTRDLDDPLVKALHGMIDHAADTDRRLRLLVERLAKAGIPVEEVLLREDGFDPQKLGKMVD